MTIHFLAALAGAAASFGAAFSSFGSSTSFCLMSFKFLRAPVTSLFNLPSCSALI